jgi:surface antigen
VSAESISTGGFEANTVNSNVPNENNLQKLSGDRSGFEGQEPFGFVEGPLARVLEAEVSAVPVVSSESAIRQSVRGKLRRLTAAMVSLSLVTAGAVAESMVTAESASANVITYSNLGYPYPNEPCEHSPYTTSGGANYCYDYDWGPTPDYTSGWAESDSYDPNYGGYGYRNCTDFVAWKIDTTGGDVPGDLGDGGSWYSNAPADDRESGPEPGYVAVSPSLDHVAYVESVNSGGTITVEEYNADEAGEGDTQTGTPASMGFTEYLNFGGTPTSSAGSTDTPPPSPYKQDYLAAATNTDGTIELFAVGTDNEIYVDRQSAPNTDSWNGWWMINAGADSVAVAANADGALEEFSVGPNGDVYYRYQETPSIDSWSNEESFPETNVAGPISATTNPDGTIELFAVGTNGEVYVNRQSAPNTDSWNGWWMMNAGAISSATAVNQNGALEEFYVGNNDSMYYRYQESPGVDSWSNEENISSDLDGQVAAATNTDGTIELFATGTNNDVYVDRQYAPNTDAWYGWYEINAGVESLAVTSNEDGALEEFGIGTNGAIYYRYQESASTDDWSNEESISGDLMH